MKSVAAQKTFKFMLGAIMGLGVGLPFLDSIAEAPLSLGIVWVIGIVLSGFLGMRIFKVFGNVALPGEELSASAEVRRVILYSLSGALMMWWISGG